jgi:hypothetical protein
VTPQILFRLGASAAVLGGALRIASAFIPYEPQSVPHESVYAGVDLLLLLGLTATYAREAETLGWSGLAAFLTAFSGLASIVGPDATMFAVDWYQVGAAVTALGLAALALALVMRKRLVAPALCWLAVPGIALIAPGSLATDGAGIAFGLGFVLSGLAHLNPPAAGTS